MIIEIWAECSLFSCSLFLAKRLFSFEELDLPLQARFNSDWWIAFFLACCLRSLMFSSVELELLGLEDKKSSASWSEFFLRRFFLIKGRWFMAVLSRGNPVPCYPNMHFLAEIERSKSVAVDTFFCDQVKYLFLRFFKICLSKPE